eukprot:CAMPEP_0198510368 /NCGR_PEP_ID=MMETSP1462-20131121/14139_1 /TAXON_ID=1333877 /ORGANISM="Brandtodinium nutriculum, Strain RCC3387" /LENGTH=176 /DNA_ID=CAMNT_0044239697 /DNA_START=84 /DNA_END=611 /DNA_ORIENTATION=-
MSPTGERPPAAYTGMAFVKEYYSVLAKEPENVHKFYKDPSLFYRGAEGSGADEIRVEGPGNIDSEIKSRGERACRVEISSVESQESMQGGVLVLVTGYLTFAGTQERQRFTQTFFLHPQSDPYDGYFVLNDILRYVGADGAEKQPARQAPQPQAPAPAQAPSWQQPTHPPAQPPSQ